MMQKCWYISIFASIMTLSAFFYGLAFVAAQEAPAEAEKEVPDIGTHQVRIDRLAIRQAQLEMVQAMLERDRAKRQWTLFKTLQEEGLIAAMQVDEALRDYEDQKIRYEQAVLNVERVKLQQLKKAIHISIAEAKKYRDENAELMAEITLVNNSNLNMARIVEPDMREPDIVKLLEVQNILVSLKAESGALVSRPYEATIPELKFKRKAILTFGLLRDLEEITVSLSYLDLEILRKVTLTKEATLLFPRIESAQFSQEGILGTKVRYDIAMEHLGEEERTFHLAVVNLPREVDSFFINPTTQARIAQVKFSGVIPKQEIELELAIPEKLTRSYVNKRIEFFAYVTDAPGFKAISAFKEKYGDTPVSEEELNTVEGSSVTLELIPRGVGKLELIIPNRFQEIKVGEKVTVRLDVQNTGTLEVNNVKLDLSLPYQWQAEAVPALLKEIRADEKQSVVVRVTPATELGVGEYDIRFIARGEVGSERVESPEKIVSIRVETRTNIIGIAILVGALIMLVLAIAIISIKISRR